RAFPYRWRPGVRTARRYEWARTAVPPRLATHRPPTARGRAHLHRAARARPRRVPGVSRRSGLADAAVRGGRVSVDGKGLLVIITPDPQGMRKIKSQLPEALTIFIRPPSIEALQRRLEHRGTETPEQRAVRLRNAEIEMAAAPEYDYVVVNEDGKLDETVDKI